MLFCRYVHELNIKMDSENLPIQAIDLGIMPDVPGKHNLLAYSRQNLVQSVLSWSGFGIIVSALRNFIENLSSWVKKFF